MKQKVRLAKNPAGYRPILEAAAAPAPEPALLPTPALPSVPSLPAPALRIPVIIVVLDKQGIAALEAAYGHRYAAVLNIDKWLDSCTTLWAYMFKKSNDAVMKAVVRHAMESIFGPDFWLSESLREVFLAVAAEQQRLTFRPIILRVWPQQAHVISAAVSVAVKDAQVAHALLGDVNAVARRIEAICANMAEPVDQSLAGPSGASGQPVVVYNAATASEADQRALRLLLPESHTPGDRHSILSDGRVLKGKAAHDDYCSPELRLRCRRRAFVATLSAHARGGFGPHARSALEKPLDVLACLVCVPDWQGEGLDVDACFVKKDEVDGRRILLPPLGPNFFDCQAYIRSVAEDLVMSLQALKGQQQTLNGKRLHLKIAPLGIGPNIRSRHGDHLGPMLMVCYTVALGHACAQTVSAEWVECLELIDLWHGSLTPQIAWPKTVTRPRVLQGSTADVLDFRHASAEASPAIIVPADPFALVGLSQHDHCLSAGIANNTNLRLVRLTEPLYVAWQSK